MSSCRRRRRRRRRRVVVVVSSSCHLFLRLLILLRRRRRFRRLFLGFIGPQHVSYVVLFLGRQKERAKEAHTFTRKSPSDHLSSAAPAKRNFPICPPIEPRRLFPLFLSLSFVSLSLSFVRSFFLFRSFISVLQIPVRPYNFCCLIVVVVLSSCRRHRRVVVVVSSFSASSHSSSSSPSFSSFYFLAPLARSMSATSFYF